METLVATVLIVVVFMMASMVLNGLFAGSIKGNHNGVHQELLRLQYRNQNGQLQLPYHDHMGNWELEVTEVDWPPHKRTVFRARHASGNREIILSQ